MKLAISNPALSESFRDTDDYIAANPERPDLICGITGLGRRSSTIKAGKIQSTLRRYRRYAIEDCRTRLEKCSQQWYV